MKHTNNYMDSKWVVENPEKYDIRDVERANSFIASYNEGYEQALSLGGAVSNNEDIKERYLVSEVIFFEIKNSKIMDKRGVEISIDFILKHEHYLGKGWGYVIL